MNVGDLVATSMSGAEMGKMKDFTGQRFGRLVAVKALDERRRGSVVWVCDCDCGRPVNIPVNNFAYGDTKSCGCLGRESRIKAIDHILNLKLKKASERISFGEKRCPMCNHIKDLSHFSKRSKRYYDGLNSWCKTCCKKIKKNYDLSEKGTFNTAMSILKKKAPRDIYIPTELIEARAEIIKIRRKIKEMTK